MREIPKKLDCESVKVGMLLEQKPAKIASKTSQPQ